MTAPDSRVSPPPYPVHPTPLTKSWLERHPLAKIPAGCLILVLLFAVFGGVVATIVTTSFRSSDVYKQALAKAVQNTEVRGQLGEPILPAWLITGELHVNGSSGNANISIPISGPRGRGLIRAVAIKSSGIWRFTYLQVSVNGQPGCIDLLSIQPPPERDF